MTAIDETLFQWINGLAGRLAFFDELFKGIANDYFILVSSCLVLLALWFGTRRVEQRQVNQKAVIYAAASMGVAQGFVALSNLFYFRPRPFTELPTNLLFYPPTDSSFPSNSTAIISAIAIAIFLADRRAGTLLLLLALLHGFSRIYVGVHYPFDVLAAVVIAALTAFCFSRVIKILEPWPSRLLELMRNIYLA